MGGLHLVPAETLMVVAMYCMCTSMRDTIHVVSSMWYTARALMRRLPGWAEPIIRVLTNILRGVCMVRKYLYQHLVLYLRSETERRFAGFLN